jgi:DMSO/TMAO reductase YedYZ molybdopterin-dependent catalytic subunit
MYKNKYITGALFGLIFTIPLIIIFHLGWKIAGLPFPPYDIFDLITRILPGSMITFTIDTMVGLIRSLNIGNTADVAKSAEQTMAILIFIGTGMASASILFFIFQKLNRSVNTTGSLFGLFSGILVLIISYSIDRIVPVSPFLSGLWILFIMSIWGLLIGWSYKHFIQINEKHDIASAKGSRQVERLDRRRFLIKVGAASAVFTVTGAVVDILLDSKHKIESDINKRWSSNHELPNHNAQILPAPGTRPEFTPLEEHYRIDINTMPPSIKAENWRLKVTGLVEKPLEFSLDDIRNYPPMHQFITLACISNPIGGDLTSTTRWTGVSLQKFLPNLKLKPNASHLKISSADGFFEIVALDTINKDDRVMLAYAWDGVPLRIKHGFPLRIYIPDRYGMKQPKWIEKLEAIDHWEAGYWVKRGWDKDARMKATSVIDTIAVNSMFTDMQDKPYIPVGGIAHAGARGISKVQIRIDDHDWQDARLREPLSELTWVIWRYDMPFKEGNYAISVRCFDGEGNMQIEEPSKPHPSGATGLQTKEFRL